MGRNGKTVSKGTSWPPKESLEKFDREIGGELKPPVQQTLFNVNSGYGDEHDRKQKRKPSASRFVGLRR